MQFFIFDFALAFAALLGYGALMALLRRRAAVVSVGAGITLKAIARQPVAPTRATGSERPMF